MKKFQILIVEDDKPLLNIFQQSIEKDGYEADIAENGKIAMSMWRKKNYDLLLVDLRMPEMNGIELIKSIKTEAPLTQVIIISGQGNDFDLVNAINKHVYKFLTKPVDLDKLLLTIQKALEERDLVLQALEEMTERYPDKPILIVGKEKYTPHRLYDEVRRMTSLGKQFHENLKKSMIDLNVPEDDISEDELLGMTTVVD